MSKSEANFICPLTNEEFFIHQYTTSVDSDGETIYKDRWRKVLINPKNNEKLVLIEKEVDWATMGAPAVIAGKDRSGRDRTNKQLAKRSKEHYKKEIAESKRAKNIDLIKKFES